MKIIKIHSVNSKYISVNSKYKLATCIFYIIIDFTLGCSQKKPYTSLSYEPPRSATAEDAPREGSVVARDEAPRLPL